MTGDDTATGNCVFAFRKVNECLVIGSPDLSVVPCSSRSGDEIGSRKGLSKRMEWKSKMLSKSKEVNMRSDLRTDCGQCTDGVKLNSIAATQAGVLCLGNVGASERTNSRNV